MHLMCFVPPRPPYLSSSALSPCHAHVHILPDSDDQAIANEAKELTKSMDLNIVRLKFTAYLQDSTGAFTRALKPVISVPIYDSSESPSLSLSLYLSLSLSISLPPSISLSHHHCHLQPHLRQQWVELFMPLSCTLLHSVADLFQRRKKKNSSLRDIDSSVLCWAAHCLIIIIHQSLIIV